MISVLVVEDDPTQRQLLEWELGKLTAKHAFEFAAAENLQAARAALAALKGRVLILCDARLPDGSGVEFLQDALGAGIEGVLLTASAIGLQTGDLVVHQKGFDLAAERVWLETTIAAWCEAEPPNSRRGSK